MIVVSQTDSNLTNTKRTSNLARIQVAMNPLAIMEHHNSLDNILQIVSNFLDW